jgi:hypothetical protein
VDKLTGDPARCRAKSCDIVLNGTELGSGSTDIHRREVQSKVFAALGLSEDEARRRFVFLLDALEFAAPPHGGIALRVKPEAHRFGANNRLGTEGWLRVANIPLGSRPRARFDG